MTPYDHETQRLKDALGCLFVGFVAGILFLAFSQWEMRAHNAPPSPDFKTPAPELRKSDLREPAGSYFVDGVEFCRI